MNCLTEKHRTASVTISALQITCVQIKGGRKIEHKANKKACS